MVRDLSDVEVSQALGVHVRTVQRWCSRGSLPGAYKAGRRWRIPVEALREVQLRSLRYADPLRRDIRAAVETCRDLRDAAQTIRAGHPNTPPEHDWPGIAAELRELERVLDGLPIEIEAIGT